MVDKPLIRSVNHPKLKDIKNSKNNFYQKFWKQKSRQNFLCNKNKLWWWNFFNFAIRPWSNKNCRKNECDTSCRYEKLFYKI